MDDISVFGYINNNINNANIFGERSNTLEKSERGFVEPFLNKEETIQPEVIDNINDIKENNMLIQGSLTKHKQKSRNANERIFNSKKVVITMVEK